MANCRSDQHSGHEILNLKNRKEVKESLYGMLAIDNDMTENGPDYWEDSDNLDKNGEVQSIAEELGYEDEADRIVGEAMKGKKVGTAKSFEAVFNKVFSTLASQEYFGDCDYDIIDLKDGRVSLSWVVGGYDQY